MKRLSFILLLISSLSFGQKTDIEELINQVAKDEVPENFEYYFLVSKSLEKKDTYDTIQNFQIRELKMIDKNFQSKFIQKKLAAPIDWKNYNLKNVHYVSNEFLSTSSPPRNMNVHFVKFNINQKKYDSLVKNKKPYTLIVKKKWVWNKNRIWSNKKFHELLTKAWEKDKKENIEEEVFFLFSKPIFSENKNYAKISISKNERCYKENFMVLYRKDNGIWKKMMEYNRTSSVVRVMDSKCKNISLRYHE